MKYSGQLWQWTLDAAIAGTGDSRFALKAHTRRALRSALRARFCAEQFGAPAFCLGTGVLLILFLAIFSGGFRVLRHVTRSLSYRDPQQVVVLAPRPSLLWNPARLSRSRRRSFPHPRTVA